MGRSRFGTRQRLTGHHHPAATHQVGHERGFPIAPHTRPGGLRVRFRERVQQFEQLRIAAQRLGHALDGFGIVEVASARRYGQQEVVAHHVGDRVDVLRRQSEPLRDRDHQVGPEHAVVYAPTLADVVQQRTKRKQVRSSNAGGQRGRVDGGFDDVPVHGPFVRDIARRQVADCVPFRQEPAPQPGAVERLDGVQQRRAGQEHDQQVVQRFPGPGRWQVRGAIRQPLQRAGADRQVGVRRRGSHSQHQTGIGFGFGLTGEPDLAVVLNHALVQRSPLRAPHQSRDAAPGQCVLRGPQPGFRVVSDGTARAG